MFLLTDTRGEASFETMPSLEMRGAAMSLTAAATGFVVLLLSASVIQGEGEWGVTYTSTQICALKGSTVTISCSYKHPAREGGIDVKVEKTFWFTERRGDEYIDLKTVSEYSNRVQDHCEKNDCTLTIRNLRESDSAEYYFRFITNKDKYYDQPGVTLSVKDLDLWVSKYSHQYLQCHSSCPSDQTSYIWYKNRQKLEETSASLGFTFGSADSYSCALRGYEDFPSPSVYAPKTPVVSVSPSAEIMEGTSVTLTCSSDAKPAATYTWYKENGRNFRKNPEYFFSSIQSSDSGQYYCEARNLLGNMKSEHIYLDVKYAPKTPDVSVSPSAEIEEGSSVTLTCHSDANPAATYTWYKENQELHQGPEGIYNFKSIRSEDRGNYSCMSENQFGSITSSSVSVDVQYAPKSPSVSVSPSEIEEGSSVTLSCSSDANPAAKYTWYKENKGSPKASGQIFTITNFSTKHSGNYYCVAQNKRGRQNSTLHLITADRGLSAAVKVAAGIVTIVLLAVIFIAVFLCIRRRRASREPPEPEGRADNRAQRLPDQRQPEQQEDLQYASIRFCSNQPDLLYSNIRAAQPVRHVEQQEDVEYTAVRTAPRARGQETGEDPAALYSTVNKTR